MQGQLEGQALKGRYAIREYIGEHGTNHHFRAENLQNGDLLRVEFFGESFPLDENRFNAIRDGFAVLTALDHPNIMRLVDFGVQNQMVYVVREELEGRDLETLIGESATAPLSQAEGVNIIYQIAGALAHGEKFYLHHGFLYPHNILIEDSGRAVLLNVGVRQLLDRLRARETSYRDYDIRALGNIFDKLMLMSNVTEDIERVIFRILGYAGQQYPGFDALVTDLEYLRGDVRTTSLPAGQMQQIDVQSFGGRPAAEVLKPEKTALLSLYFPDIGYAYAIDKPGEYSIGRRFQGQPVVPDIDLTEHDAYQWGISKLHASITVRPNGGLFITDLGSANGTTIRGVRLGINRPYPVHNGDVFHIGRLKLQFVVYGQS
jgi:serine/threonine protein kinase